MSKTLKFEFKFFERPIIAIGFLNSHEFILMLGFVSMRVYWGY